MYIGALSYNLVQTGATCCFFGADWCSLVELVAVWSNLVEFGAD